MMSNPTDQPAHQHKYCYQDFFSGK
jgi:hypothetical protein